MFSCFFFITYFKNIIQPQLLSRGKYPFRNVKVLNYTYLSLILVEKCIGLMDDIILANSNLVCNMGEFVDSIVKSYY